MTNTINTPPNPDDPVAAELAQVLRARQALVRFGNKSAYPAHRTTREEHEWLTAYAAAEAARRRRERSAERETRRAQQ